MRAAPLVCVGADEVEELDRWQSVVASGRFEEVPECPGRDDALIRAQERPRQPAERLDGGVERELACRLLRTRPLWWEVRPDRDPAEPCFPVYYKIWIDHLAGRGSTRDNHAAPADKRPRL